MRVYAYCRVSTDEQGISGISLVHQESVCLRLGQESGLLWGKERFPATCKREGFFVDVQSAYKKPFAKRPAGKALLECLDPGDTLVVSRLDRAFRSTIDFCSFLDLALKNEWNVVIESPRIDLSTPSGRMMAKFFAMIAEWESDIKSQRIKEAIAVKKREKSLPRQLVNNLTVEEYIQEATPYREVAKILAAPPDRQQKTGRVFVYIRCSHRTSVESGLGLKAQLDASFKYVSKLMARSPHLIWNEDVFTDPAVSARDIPMFHRPYGKSLNKTLREGDVVVCLRPDRIFGTIHDMSKVMLEWKARGIRLHFAEIDMEMDTPFGDMVLSSFVALAQYERDIASARATEARAVLAGEGKFTGGRNGAYPPFYRMLLNEATRSRRLVLDIKQISSFRLLLRLEQKFGLPHALKRVEELIALREDRPPIPQCGVKKRGTKWASLGADYPPNSKGEIFPMWTRRRFQEARDKFPAALQAWRTQVMDEKQALRRYGNESGYVRHSATLMRRSRRWWQNKRPMRVKEFFGVG